MRRKKIIVGFDADNVLLDFTSKFIEMFNKVSDKKIKKEHLTEWNFINCVNKLYGEKYCNLAKQIIDSVEFTENLTLKKNVYKSFKAICNDPYIKVLIVTALPIDLIPHRENCFNRLFKGLNYKVIYEKNKEKISLNYIVDDGVHNLDSLSKKIPKENCLCIKELYNKDCNYNSFDDIRGAIQYIYNKEFALGA